ncbi:MAG: hypothetical protein QOH88_1768 [Verrucomicrobiota bacterium]|jgi:hypothetical protein
MNPQPLTLSADQFLLGPQEIVLINRHGCDDAGRAPLAPGATIRRSIKEGLRSREIHAHITIGFEHAVVDLTTNGFYEHEGRVCKILFLSPHQADERNKEPNVRELEALKIAGWVAEHYFANPPLGLRLYYHVLKQTGADAEINESWYREFPLVPEEEIRPLIAERTRGIAEALTQPDEALPECTVDERNGAPGSEYSKCRDWCPARAHCQQIERHYVKETERSLANERALASIVVGESPTSAERQAACRKEQISAMLMAGNFFEDDFPREVFRKLILEEAEDETTAPEKSCAYREMATSWSDSKFVAWRAWLDRQD